MESVPVDEKEPAGHTTKDRQYIETVIIGTGFSAILAAIGLKKQNIADFILFERDTDIGGTWRANSYPGEIGRAHV